MNVGEAINDTREGTKEAVKVLADRIHNLEVKCENLEAENKQQAETILRLDRRLGAWEHHKEIIYSGLDALQRRQNALQRHLEALEERLAKPKDTVII